MTFNELLAHPAMLLAAWRRVSHWYQYGDEPPQPGSMPGGRVFKEWTATASQGPFDVVFSSHVLEHTPNPGSALDDQMAVLRPGGWLVALFPNGSEPFRRAKPENFHCLWRRVHPVMLNDAFVMEALGDQVVFRGSLSESDLSKIRSISEQDSVYGDLSGSEMLLVARKSAFTEESVD